MLVSVPKRAHLPALVADATNPDVAVRVFLWAVVLFLILFVIVVVVVVA